VPRNRLTRRQTLKLGAATAALGAMRPATALARRAPASFDLPLDDLGGAASAAAVGWRTTRIYAAPRRFDLIGLRWARGSEAQAEVRARRRGGGWTPWVPLHLAGLHGPDRGRAVAGTEPAWTGSADFFQLRLRGRPRDLRACFVRSAPEAAAARRRGARLARAARQAVAPPIIPRAAWGADAAPPRAAPLYGQVQAAFVHHTATANGYAPTDSAAIVLGIARYHRDFNGWNDIGYNFLVDQYGQIFEGRAGGVDQAIVGAQAQGFNSVSTGIACLGTFTTIAQSEAGMNALARLIGWKLSLHGVPVQGAVTVTSAGGATNRFPAGTPVVLERISGHRDGNATTCPGDLLYAQLPDLRNRAARYSGQVVTGGLTVRAASTRLRGGTRAVISGALAFPDGSPPAGAAVDVLFATAGAAFTRLAGAVAGPDGAWSATVTLPQTGAVRARFPGDATRAALESSDLEITILPRLVIGLSANRIRRGRRAVASGTVTPPGRGGAEVVLERRVGKRWVIEQRKRTPIRAGRYRTPVRPRRAGLYRLWIKSGGSSVSRRLRVLAR
jgi:hypothetical protein